MHAVFCVITIPLLQGIKRNRFHNEKKKRGNRSNLFVVTKTKIRKQPFVFGSVCVCVCSHRKNQTIQNVRHRKF